MFTGPIMCMGFPGSSSGKESSCNAGDLGSIPGSGRSAGSAGEGIGIGFPLWLSWKRICHNEGDLGSVPGLGRSPGEVKGYPL